MRKEGKRDGLILNMIGMMLKGFRFQLGSLYDWDDAEGFPFSAWEFS
jgi:hypothetical protein